MSSGGRLGAEAILRESIRVYNLEIDGFYGHVGSLNGEVQVGEAWKRTSRN
jgi:hypothetical protein